MASLEAQEDLRSNQRAMVEVCYEIGRSVLITLKPSWDLCVV